MRKVFLVITSLWLGMTVNAAVINYTADDVTIFKNPERGFTEEMSRIISDTRNHVILDANYEGFFEEKGINSETERPVARPTETLVMVLYNLQQYRTKELSSQMLQGFDEDMQELRNKGFKCVLRFAYTEYYEGENDKDDDDAGLERVLAHIAQLKPYLAKNADVIYVMEAGFVGIWGEWYYSKYFGDQTQHMDNPKKPGSENRRQVITALLDACPADRFLLVRYPMIKGEYFGAYKNPDTTPLGFEEAFTGTPRARIGHHNDAFLNEWGNDGTYAGWDDNKSDDPNVRKYIADETLFVPNGGETNVESTSLANQVYNKAETEMATYHWSFCGESYAKQVTVKWIDNGIFDNLNRKMGYRYQLVKATLPDQAAAGGKANVNIQIKNVGYAPLYNERHAYIVLKNNTNTYSIKLASDPRRWLPAGTVTTINEQITIPSNVPVGSYDLYLHMPDKYASLAADPRYAVRFANTNVWDSITGMNKLNASINITEATTPEPPIPDDAVELPATLNKANINATSDDTWWTTDASYYDFGSEDAENISRWAQWKVYLRYPGQYIISVVNGFVGDDYADGNRWQLTLSDDATTVSTFTGDTLYAIAQHTYTNKWNLSAVPAGVYTLRVMNIDAWEQPKLKSLTLQFDGQLPDGIEETKDEDPRVKSQKILRDGQLIIIRGEKKYNILGVEL